MTTAPISIRRLILLLGFMGSGKTTVGQRLARRLGWAFADLDGEIERRLGHTIRQIFEEKGEPYFRRVERALLEELLQRGQQESLVMALGGGTVAQPGNFELLRAHGGITVWLDCPLEELRRRCQGLTQRPLFKDAASFRALFEQRLPFYRQADFRVPADRSDPERVVEDILQCVKF
jgi:shikimate kinase